MRSRQELPQANLIMQSTFLLILLAALGAQGVLRNLGSVSLKGAMAFGVRPKGVPPIKHHYASSSKGAYKGSSSPLVSCCKGKLKLLGQKLFGYGTFKGEYNKPPEEVSKYREFSEYRPDGAGGVLSGGGGGTVSDSATYYKGGRGSSGIKISKPGGDIGGGGGGGGGRTPPSYAEIEYRKYGGGGTDTEDYYGGGGSLVNEGSGGGGLIGPLHSNTLNGYQYPEGGGGSRGRYKPTSAFPEHQYHLPTSSGYERGYHQDHPHIEGHHNTLNEYDHGDRGYSKDASYPPTPPSFYHSNSQHLESYPEEEYPPHPESHPTSKNRKEASASSYPSQSQPPSFYHYFSGPEPLEEKPSLKEGKGSLSKFDNFHPYAVGSSSSSSSPRPPLPFGRGEAHSHHVIEYNHHYPNTPLDINVLTSPPPPPLPPSALFAPPPLPPPPPPAAAETEQKQQPPSPPTTSGLLSSNLLKSIRPRPFTQQEESQWIPVQGPNHNDYKYRVYEYGENEVFVIDGGGGRGLDGKKGLVRAHVYSKDGGTLLRTIEIDKREKGAGLKKRVDAGADVDEGGVEGMKGNEGPGLEQKEEEAASGVIVPQQTE